MTEVLTSIDDITLELGHVIDGVHTNLRLLLCKLVSNILGCVVSVSGFVEKKRVVHATKVRIGDRTSRGNKELPF